MKSKSKLTYRGVVYFYSEDTDGNRVLLSKHNAGTIALARLFAKMLVGRNLSLLLPKYIDVFDVYGASVLITPCLIQNAHAEDGYQDLYPDDLPIENCRAYFEAQISKKQLKINAARSAHRVVLLDGNMTELANIELEESEFADVFEANDNLVIIWQMELIYDDIFEEVPDEYK